MSDPWLPIATRGCLALDVLTKRRAHGEDIGLGGCEYLLRLRPDGDSSPIDMRCATGEAARLFIAEMQPHTLRLLLAPDEDKGAAIARIEGRVS